jgi:hypothetical protein
MVHHLILPYRFTRRTTAGHKHPRHDTDRVNCFTVGGEEVVVEESEHKVFLNSYYLGIYEVTKKIENVTGKIRLASRDWTCQRKMSHGPKQMLIFEP